MWSWEVWFQSIFFCVSSSRYHCLSFWALKMTRAGPAAPLPLTAVATETGSKHDSWEKSSLYYLLLLMSNSQNKLGQRAAEASQRAVLASRGIDWAVHPQNFWGVNFMFFYFGLLHGDSAHLSLAGGAMYCICGWNNESRTIQFCHCTLRYHRQLQPCLLNNWTGEHFTFLLSADDICNRNMYSKDVLKKKLHLTGIFCVYTHNTTFPQRYNSYNSINTQNHIWFRQEGSSGSYFL